MDFAQDTELQQALQDALVEIATQQLDPLAYIQGARAELEILLTQRFGVEHYQRDPKGMRATIARALDAIWPDVLKRLSN